MTERFGDGTTRTAGETRATARPAVPRPARRMRSTTRSWRGQVIPDRRARPRRPRRRGDGPHGQAGLHPRGHDGRLLLDRHPRLQHGVPLDILVADHVGTRFEPSGLTNDPDIKQAGSVMDYVGRRLALDHLPYETRAGLGILTAAERAAKQTLDGVGEAVWTDLVGLSMSAPVVGRPRRD